MFFISRKKQKPLLILDLNNVLIFRVSHYTLVNDFPSLLESSSAECLGRDYVWKRPHLDAFLKYAFENFEVAVWSSEQKPNVSLLCEYVFTFQQRSKLLFEWDQSFCVKEQKRLSDVWSAFPQYNDTNTLILNVSPLNPTKCVIVTKPWIATQEDDNALARENGTIFKRLESVVRSN